MTSRRAEKGAGRLLSVLLACLVPLALMAEPPRAGLMWNRTGLPAAFPLQVRTSAGADYYLILSDAETGEAALGAYIDGGKFFKVLVPPGRYVLRFASGKRWQGEERLFGPGAQTRRFELPYPLEFAIRGAGIKGGHVVTLSREPPGGGLQAAVKAQYICQIASLEAPELLPGRAQPLRQFHLGGDARSRGILHLQWRLQLGGPQAGTPLEQWQRSLFLLGNPLLPPRASGLDGRGGQRPPARFRSYSVRSLFCG
ncbi:hypothetical protein [Leisingera caerulea]|uniref:Uncharacterized protein n=1 Tax=Leisingera caerulea TaxID=506591 RepID=A0A9Q9HMW0_LEICA|nr:hypothetical protein [Leisingera caerulea]UWQ55120.1 hypothetical protein K3721_06175 [Leisingera caerulea]